MISVDALRADHLPMYGYDKNTSPNLEEFADDNILFERAFTQSPWTTPAHISMFTSLYPSQHGNDAESEQFEMIAEVLKDEGYSTYGFHGGANVRGDIGFDRGFDEYREVNNTGERYDEAEDFFEDRLTNNEEPFFLFYHNYQVHDPYIAPEGYKDYFEDSEEDFRQETIEKWNNISADVQEEGYVGPEATGEVFERHREWFFNELEENMTLLNHTKAEYDAGIRATDDFLADFMDLLKEEEMYEDTIIIVTADHGEEFYDHGGWLHNQVYNEVIHVPLIVKLPDMEAEEVEGAVELVDLVPTIQDALEIPEENINHPIEGQSLLKSMEEGGKDWTLAQELETDQKAYINWSIEKEYLRDETGQEFLFDMEEDFEEQNPQNDTELLNELREERKDVETELSELRNVEERLRELGYIQE